MTGGRKESVWATWRDNAERHPDREAVVHWTAGEEPHRWRWGDLLQAAQVFSRALGDAGVQQGDVCAIIVRHHRLFYPIYLACSALGALPAVLAYPNPRLHPDKFRQGIEGMSSRSGLDWILTERSLEPQTRPLVTKPGSTIRGLLFPLEWETQPSTPAAASVAHPPKHPDEPCLLQHSSGTTGLQKAVVLSHRAILEHVERYARAIAANPSDRIVSWLPLYHDMGLIAAFYLPLTLGIPLVQLDPFEWVLAPPILLDAISRERGTLAWLPNFAYNLLADRCRDEDLDGVRLDSVRMLINCSEPVRAESHERFYRRFSRFGLRRSALAACYAMAETTFAVTQTPPGQEAKRIAVHWGAVAEGVVSLASGSEDARSCVSSGRPIPGCEVRVTDGNGRDLPEGRIGELVLRSVSLFDGYRNSPEKTAEVLRDGWYFSGDYGFRLAEEIYVIGRKKDIIIVAGKNIYPEDIEDTVGQVPGALAGRVVAFGVEDPESGTEQICVVAETTVGTETERSALRRAVIGAGMQIDVTISRVYLVEPRWLIKSSAGKPARRENKERALGGLDWR